MRKAQRDKHTFVYEGKCEKCGCPVRNATGYPYHLACTSAKEAREWVVTNEEAA